MADYLLSDPLDVSEMARDLEGTCVGDMACLGQLSPGHGAAGPHSRPHPAAPSDSARRGAPWECAECGVETVPRVQAKHVERVCPDCHRIFAGLTEDDEFGEDEDHATSGRRAPDALRFQFVGVEKNAFQSALMKISDTSGSRSCKDRVFTELVAHNRVYMQEGGKGIPENLLRETAERYAEEVQKLRTVRNYIKLEALALILREVLNSSSNDSNIRTDRELAAFMKTRRLGFSRVRGLLASWQHEYREKNGETGPVTLVPANTLENWVTSTFVALGLEIIEALAPGEQKSRLNSGDRALLGHLRAAAVAICSRAQELCLHTTFTERTQGIAAAYVVLRRAELPAHWLIDAKGKPAPIELGVVLSACSIRRNTVQNFVTMLRKFHSKFEPVYKRFEINPAKRI